MEDGERKINQELLEQMPTRWYHATNKKGLNENTFYEMVRIFDNADDYIKYEKLHNIFDQNEPMKNYGRTNLDGGFHGFYLIANKEEALRWSKKSGKNNEKRLLIIDINPREIISNNCISLCFPNLEWSKFVVENRNSKTRQNIYKASYTMIMDGRHKIKTVVEKMINSNDETSYYKYYLKTIPQNIIKYRNIDGKWDYQSFLKESSIKEGRCLQLCISSQELLNTKALIRIGSEPIL